MTTKYKVGDKVKIIENLNPYDAIQYGCDVTLAMLDFEGKTCTIKSIHSINNNIVYQVEENVYFWTEAMFEGLVETKKVDSFTKADLKSGMVVEFKSGKRGFVIDDRIVAEYTCALLSDYDNNLDTDGPSFNIAKVFKTKSATISGIFDNNCLELIWEKNPDYNGKVVCVDAGETCCWTVGKIYQFVDGVVVNDLGECCSKIESFDQLNKASAAKWLEVVE